MKIIILTLLWVLIAKLVLNLFARGTRNVFSHDFDSTITKDTEFDRENEFLVFTQRKKSLAEISRLRSHGKGPFDAA
jgi:hypothetical protein